MASSTSVHWVDVGEPNAPDRDILEHPHRNGQVILTQDLDFGTLLAIGGLATPSVIQFRAQAVLPSDVGEQLLAGVAVARTHLETGALVTVDPLGHGVTVLAHQHGWCLGPGGSFTESAHGSSPFPPPVLPIAKCV
jgi:predicted nuclease of predicted toxin-antitoxin system